MNIDIKIVQQILLAARLIERPTDKVFSVFGLTIKTHEILLLIQRKVTTTTQLAEAMDLTLAGIAQKTKVLEQKGFISRKSGEDLRVWQFELTKKGVKTLKDIVFLYESVGKKLFGGFTQAEKMSTLMMLEKVTDHVSGIKDTHIKNFIAQLKTR